MCYFTKLDLARSYHQLRVRASDRWKTSFRLQLGQFEWNMVKFGLQGSSSLLMHVMNQVLTVGLDYPIRRSTIHRTLIRRGTIRRDTIRHDTIRHDTTHRYNGYTIRRDAIRHDTIHRNTVHRDTIRRGTSSSTERTKCGRAKKSPQKIER